MPASTPGGVAGMAGLATEAAVEVEGRAVEALAEANVAAVAEGTSLVVGAGACPPQPAANAVISSETTALFGNSCIAALLVSTSHRADNRGGPCEE